MSEMDKLEERRKRLAEAKKQATKKLRAAKRKEARKQAKEAMEKERDEAMLFLVYAKQKDIFFGQGENRTSEKLFDWQRKDFEKWKQETQADGAPGRAQ